MFSYTGISKLRKNLGKWEKSNFRFPAQSWEIRQEFPTMVGKSKLSISDALQAAKVGKGWEKGWGEVGKKAWESWKRVGKRFEMQKGGNSRKLGNCWKFVGELLEKD